MTKRIIHLRGIDPQMRDETLMHVNLLTTALYGFAISSFCEFPDNDAVNPHVGPDAERLGMEIEQLYFGQPDEGFMPTCTTAHSAAVPGDGDLCVYFPGRWIYAANALLYANRNGKVLVNDSVNMPFPGMPATNPKANAEVLSTMLALEAVKFALPRVQPMFPPAIEEFRGLTRDCVRPFRLGMLKLSKELNGMLHGNETLEEVEKHAKFVVQTSVYPELLDMKKMIKEPGRPGIGGQWRS